MSLQCKLKNVNETQVNSLLGQIITSISKTVTPNLLYFSKICIIFVFQFRPWYVVSSFIFLLLGLASLSSSINLLVLKFMILSLEDEEEADLQDVTQNVITVDDEYLNGPMLGRSQLFLAVPVGGPVGGTVEKL